jgi:hypothetical protein
MEFSHPGNAISSSHCNSCVLLVLRRVDRDDLRTDAELKASRKVDAECLIQEVNFFLITKPLDVKWSCGTLGWDTFSFFRM